MMQLYTLLCSVRPSTADESLTVCRCESRSSRSSTSFFVPLIVEYEVHGASTSLQCTCSFSCSFSCRWTSMSGWKLCFVLLLYLPVCFNSEGNKNKHAMHYTIKCFFFKNIAIFNLLLFAVSEFKTIGRGPDVTPICSNTTEIITLILCKIRTNRTGAECRLLYRYGGDFENECDSRFTLKMENQTVFLHLTGLTPVDSGNYTCECSRGGETHFLHLNITVEGKPISYVLPFYRVNSRHVSDKELFLYDVSGEEERESGVTSHTRLLNALIGATTVICITAVIFGLIYRGKRHRRQTEPPHTPENTEAEAIAPYSTFMLRDSVLYSTVGPHNCLHNSNQSNTSTTEDTRPEALL
uniref:uncharacterized protein LOC120824356 isoform X2 n=1 Tax=Gasterosteus aculeatus aculeatus TaxID=481459 RepID=UPI001A994CF1|nr:uncharacterized protein LOC120824356 isoform X2 [Gasterosteus aculeatus aculeatus]